MIGAAWVSDSGHSSAESNICWEVQAYTESSRLYTYIHLQDEPQLNESFESYLYRFVYWGPSDLIEYFCLQDERQY